MSIVVLKLGGSLITEKSKFKTIKREILQRVSYEIKNALDENPKLKLIICHGGGSFGHILAKKYKLNKGYQSQTQIKGVVETRHAMEILNKNIVEELINTGVNAISLQTSAMFTTKNKRVEYCYLKNVKDLLQHGFVPVVYGDVVVDEKLKFCILSGDQICVYLGNKLDANKVIFAGNTNGVFDKDPKKPDAEIIELIDKKSLKHVETSDIGDVTGGMKGKLEEISKSNVENIVMNGLVKNNIYKILTGKNILCTKII